MFKICQEFDGKLKAEIEQNNNNMAKLEETMNDELGKVRKKNVEAMQKQKAQYVSQNLDLLNKLTKLRKEHDDLTKEATIKEKQIQNTSQQCEILNQIHEQYRADFRTMTKRISDLEARLEDQASVMTKRISDLEDQASIMTKENVDLKRQVDILTNEIFECKKPN